MRHIPPYITKATKNTDTRSNLTIMCITVDVSCYRKGLFPYNYTDIIVQVQPFIKSLYPFADNIEDAGWADAFCNTIQWLVYVLAVHELRYEEIADE